LPKGVVILASISYILLLFAVHWQRQDLGAPKINNQIKAKPPAATYFCRSRTTTAIALAVTRTAWAVRRS
jgi:hypothetical protein